MVRPGKVEALILSRRNIGEADRLLTVFSRQYGLFKVVAKGVRKLSSRRGGHLEPLTQALCFITGSRGHYFLGGIDPLRLYSALRADREAMSRAQRLSAVVIQLLEEEQTYEPLYDGLSQAWELWPTLPLEKQLLLEATLLFYVVRLAGLSPNLTRCLVCGRLRPDSAVLLDGQHGGWRCLTCHTSFADTEYSLPPEMIRVLRFLEKRPDEALLLRVSTSQADQLFQALYRYVTTVMAQHSLGRIPVYAR